MLDLAALTEVSARIGAEPLLVQGPGGNTSLKAGDELWVKASGVWLAEALERPIFTGLRLSTVRGHVARGEVEDFADALLPQDDPPLRPSIETALHALMPHAAVVHAHAVNAMTVSVLADGRERARRALDGRMSWGWVEYRRPGAPLAAAVGQALANGPVDVLILENHGIVVGGAAPGDAEARLRQAEALLELEPRELPRADPWALTETELYEVAPGVSDLALDPELTRALSAAPLVPDQVVFVGGAVPALRTAESLDQAVERTRAASGVTPALVLAPGKGTLALKDRSRAAEAVIQGLYEIARRIPPGAQVRGLPEGAAEALLGWEAEAYRIKLARQSK